MDKIIKNINKYVYCSDKEALWGMHIVGAGFIETKQESFMKAGRVLDHFAVVYLTAGTGEYRTFPDKPCDVAAGDLLFLFPKVKHYYSPTAKTGWNEYWIIFDGSYPQSLLDNGIFSIEEPVLHPGLDGPLARKFEQVVDLVTTSPENCQNRGRTLLMDILGDIRRLSDHKQVKSPPECIQKTIALMTKKIDVPPNYRELAKQFGVSYPHFRRLFHETTGQPLHQYHLGLKMLKAREMLETGCSIKDVSNALGFEDPYYFSRIFRKKTGVAPSRWIGMT